MEDHLLKKSLGKGLGSLIRSNEKTLVDRDEAGGITSVFISDIIPNKNQPRTTQGPYKIQRRTKQGPSKAPQRAKQAQTKFKTS